MYKANDPRIADTNKAPVVAATFSSRPFGYPYLDASNHLTVSLDPIDGKLLHYTWKNFCDIESHSARVTKAQAMAAEVAVRPQLASRNRPVGTSKLKSVALGYVWPRLPQYMVPGKRIKLRLAWAFEYPEGKVFIDAGNRKSLGVEKAHDHG